MIGFKRRWITLTVSFPRRIWFVFKRFQDRWRRCFRKHWRLRLGIQGALYVTIMGAARTTLFRPTWRNKRPMPFSFPLSRHRSLPDASLRPCCILIQQFYIPRRAKSLDPLQHWPLVLQTAKIQLLSDPLPTVHKTWPQTPFRLQQPGHPLQHEPILPRDHQTMLQS